MYGKIFDSIYDGTLYGNWEAIATFQQFIVLANADGIVDMTPQAIAARTSFPLDLLQRGIKFLESPDPYSRTPGDEGRRIALIDPEHRPWGWRIVNHGKYVRLRDMAQKREADRVRISEKRKKNNDVAIESQMSPSVANVAHAYADADTNKNIAPDGAFERFWTAWPKHERKQAKGKCSSLWRQKGFDQQAVAILAHVEALKRSADWLKEEGRYIPAPLVYLNQRRWEGAEAPEPQGPKVAMP